VKVTVAVVGICSARHIARCLEALGGQEAPPSFDVLVVHDPNIVGVSDLSDRFGDVRFVVNAGQRTPLELAGRAVVGGRVEIAENASAVDWAFYFVDFFRYAAPAREGPSPSLTVCNACYRKADLAAVAGLWSTDFHETAIHDALRARFGPLWLEPRSEVTMARHVKLRDALYERYAFGRLFGCKRIRFISRGRRLYYAILAPALPALLLLRMARKALRSRRLARAFLRSLLPLTAMVLTWSWGEWLGYVTGRHPRSLVVAPEIRTSRRDAATGQDFDPGPNR